MATPANRVPVRIARGSKANLDTAIAAGDLKEGEICYATDENGIYVVEGGVLTQAGADLAATSIDALSDVDTTTAAPTDGQVLIWNNVDGEWQPGDAISDVVSDTTPQLGGNLDVNGNYISSASGGNVEVAPDTTGDFVVRGNNTDGSITLNCTTNTHGVKIQSPPHSAAATYTLVLPDNTGTSGQALTTDGSGGLSWSAPAADLSSTSIDALSDVDTTTVAPTDGQALVWDNANSQWEPGTISGGAAPTPSVVDSTIDSDSTAATSQVLTAPSSSEGDLLVACIMSRISGGTPTPPSGWTLYGEYLPSLAFDQTISVFTKIATASEPASYTWTQASSSRICGFIASVSGASAIASVEENYGNAGTATVTTVSNALNITAATWIYSKSTGTETYSQSGTGLTEITDSPISQARISGGYTTEAGTVTSTHSSIDTGNNPNHGMIRITLMPTSSINDNDDVDTVTTPPTDSQVLTWVDTNSQWEPATPSIDNLAEVSTGPANTVAVTPDLLLYCEGSDGGTTFTDSSSNNYTITVNNVTTSVTQAKYGSTSAYFSNSSYDLELSTADSSSAVFFDGNDFTVETWIYPTSGSSNTGLFSYGVSDSILPSWDLVVNSNSGSESVSFHYSTNGSSSTLVTSGTLTGVTFLNQWHHVAVCRTGGTLKGYVDGAEVFSAAISGSIAEQSSYGLEIGSGYTGGIVGYMDNIRIVNGTAAYTGPFTPPDATFTTGPADGQVLTWVDANSQWEPEDLSGSQVRTALGIGEYVDDTAAGTGGVASGALYYNTTSSDYRLKS